MGDTAQHIADVPQGETEDEMRTDLRLMFDAARYPVIEYHDLPQDSED